MKKTFWIFILILTIVFLPGCSGEPKIVYVYVTQTYTNTPVESNTPTVTNTPKPTNTPRPTNTPKPTDTPRPSNTPTAIPEPVEYSGTGDDVIEVNKNFEAGIAKITNQGRSNFAVTTYDPNGDYLDLLVNTIGNYSGTRPIEFMENETVSKIEINSNGAWTVTIYPLVKEYVRICDVPGTCRGQSDDLIWLSGDDPDTVKITNQGKSNFAVWSYGSSGTDLMVNEIGDYSGTVLFEKGVFAIEVQSSGTWTIDITK